MEKYDLLISNSMLELRNHVSEKLNKNLSQQQIADVIAKNKDFISRIEAGNRQNTLTVEQLLKLCDEFGYPLVNFFRKFDNLISKNDYILSAEQVDEIPKIIFKELEKIKQNFTKS